MGFVPQYLKGYDGQNKVSLLRESHQAPDCDRIPEIIKTEEGLIVTHKLGALVHSQPVPLLLAWGSSSQSRM